MFYDFTIFTPQTNIFLIKKKKIVEFEKALETFNIIIAFVFTKCFYLK
jgi:hypothetical protein